MEDIESEIGCHTDYARHFKGKTVLCNCDNPKYSNFFRFFRQRFDQLGLKKLIVTHYNRDGSPSYKIELTKEKLDEDTINLITTPLKGDGDFRSEECIELLKEADIVVTNPPFSLFREFVAQLMKYEKKFVIIGTILTAAYKAVFPLIKEGKVRFGYNAIRQFYTPTGEIQMCGRSRWFTNLEIDKPHKDIPLCKTYKGNEANYPKYDNYDAINVAKVADIPKDYWGVMGVPITFLENYNSDQFEVISVHSNLKFTREDAEVSVFGRILVRRILPKV